MKLTSQSDSSTTPQQMVQAVQRWVETLVVEMNLCPFAKRELVKDRVRFSLTHSENEEELLEALQQELEHINDTPDVETTLLIHPHALKNFNDFNQFLGYAEDLLVEMELEGVFQIASFHPDYQFAGTEPGDAENYTNRSPYPTLHLIREESLERVITDYPDIDEIPERNIALMNQLGTDRLKALLNACINPDAS